MTGWPAFLRGISNFVDSHSANVAIMTAVQVNDRIWKTWRRRLLQQRPKSSCRDESTLLWL